MGALLAFQPARDGAPARAFDRALDWIVAAKGLALSGRAGEATFVAKFGRAHAPSSNLATSAHGWLASAGTWDHPAAKGVDDTSGLLEHLEQRGAEALDRLEGMYAALWYDARDDTLTVATDGFGRLHLFVAEAPDGVFLSTSAIALAAAVSTEPDPLAVYEFLAGGTLYEERTPFRAVRRLAGGKRYRFRRGRLEATASRPALPCGEPGSGGVADTADRLLAAYDATLERHLGGYQKLLPDLTGGVDSRLVVGFLMRAGRRFDVTVTGDRRDPDARSAARLAARLGLTLVRVPGTAMTEAQGAFPAVERAAIRAEGGYDALLYAGIAAVHDKHAQIYDASVNGSGGEVFRNYWWDRSTVSRPDAPPAAAHRFAGTAQRPGFLAAEHIRDASTHFEEVVTRSLAGLDLPAHAKLDHVYLMLRMQCWQGSIGSATNQIWPNISPLMWEAPMRVLFGADPLVRMDGHLIFELMSRFSSPFRNRLLATGFPPRRFSLPAFWRFLPGLAVAPFRLWPRVKGRLVPARPTIADREVVRSVLATGGGDVLDPRGLHLLPLLDRARYETFLARARKEGDVSRALLGRLLTLELAYRNANQARVRA